MNTIVDAILWLYWKAHKPYLSALAETVIGEADGGLDPDGPRIVAELERFLGEMRRPVYVQAMIGIYLLPNARSGRVLDNAVARWLVSVFDIWRSHAARLWFPLYGPAKRHAVVERMFKVMEQKAASEETGLVKSIILLNMIKGLLCASYLSLDTTLEAIGYKPFHRRPWNPPSGDDLAHPPRTPQGQVLHDKAIHLSQLPPKARDKRRYCVIGSGAGGAVAAYYLQQQQPDAEIVLLEAGPLFTNDQIPVKSTDSVADLYMNGGATLSGNQKYNFRQGRCVGGSTTVNNAVAFRPTGYWWEQNIKERWGSRGVVVDWDQLDRSFDVIGDALGVRQVDNRILTGMAHKVADGFARSHPELNVIPVATNLHDCIGCGRCNVGCQYGAKQSMAETLIPKFVQGGGILIPNAQAKMLTLHEHGSQQRVSSVSVRGEDGRMQVIEADRFVLAAGAYASTKLLYRSRFKGANPGVRTVGKKFSGNFGTAVVGRFSEPLDGADGLQVGYAVEVPQERMVIETAFAPPDVFGLMSSEWGTAFIDMVKTYDRAAIAVPVIGTLAYGDIKHGVSESGFVIDYRFVDEDWRRLALGMRYSADALFAAGAERVFTTRFDRRSLGPDDDRFAYFAEVGPLQYLRMDTGHLQGGNVTHPNSNLGVVDADMKVHGVSNLWITDASVIPSPITINIQWMVMALAHYASSRIAAAVD